MVRKELMLRAALLTLAASSGIILVAMNSGVLPAPEERLGIFSGQPQQPEVVYIPRMEAQQLLAAADAARQQSLNVVWSPEAQTDMWIKIAEVLFACAYTCNCVDTNVDTRASQVMKRAKFHPVRILTNTHNLRPYSTQTGD
jgi:hypothetical protein